MIGCILLAFSLSMDALGIGLSYGLRGIKIPWLSRMVIAALSVLITWLALRAGTALLAVIPQAAGKFIGAGMLFALGGFIIFHAFKEKKAKNKKSCGTVFDRYIKPLGVTVKIIRDPLLCDFDASSEIEFAEAFYLGAALSVDSFGAGISSAVSGLSACSIPITAGAFQLCMLSIGYIIGKRLNAKGIDSRILTVVSGGLLIVLAFVRAFV